MRSRRASFRIALADSRALAGNWCDVTKGRTLFHNARRSSNISEVASGRFDGGAADAPAPISGTQFASSKSDASSAATALSAVSPWSMNTLRTL